MQQYNDTSFTVRRIQNTHYSAAFSPKTGEVFKEEHDVAPVWISDRMQYVPWGADNQMPYNIIDLIESDETLATCQMFNAKVCYGSGLVYSLDRDESRVKGDEKAALGDSGDSSRTSSLLARTSQEIDDFFADNDMASYFLGVCQDFKHFGFAISVIILNEDGSRHLRICSLARRREIRENSPLSPASQRPTTPITPYLTTPHCSRASGTTQAAHRHRKGGETEELGAHQVPHRDCQLLLEQHLQGGGHH